MRRTSARAWLEVCILAGGLSTRMGHDKARLKLDGRTMLSRIRSVANEFSAANALSARVRVIRKDRVARCGPLGGILTGLQTSKERAVLFFACDMPLVSMGLLKRIMRASQGGERNVFVSQRGHVGFPCLLLRDAAVMAKEQIDIGEFSLHTLAKGLSAHRLKVSVRNRELLNVNTPQDLEKAEQRLTKALKERT